VSITNFQPCFVFSPGIFSPQAGMRVSVLCFLL